ncbi:HD domain-containing phosphohydrolase [Acetobacterium wieringae]|uniref:HD domain-containing phosphohydrolase n=1 Tax=Acetobacterium wieringae TaxID=52694 RepID=UPI002B206496|nr:HD domain-containing phosphohydrolase [Acetobacterium wieringae]MEA4806214.1 PAS domain S-box protein [Acetobacterium wieringae]
MKQHDQNFLLKRITKKKNTGAQAATMTPKVKKGWRRRPAEADYLEMMVEYNSEAMALLLKTAAGWVYCHNNWEHEKLTGYSQKAIRNQPLKTVLGEAYFKVYEKNADDCLKSGKTILFKAKACWNGQIRERMCRMTPVSGATQDYIVVTELNTTVIKDWMAKNHLATTRFDAMFQTHTATMLLIEPVSGRIVEANPAALAFYGYSLEEITAMTIDQINTLSKAAVDALRHQALAGQQRYFLFPHRLKNGEIRMVDVHSSPLELDGQPYLFSVITDATEREQNAAALYQEKERYKTTMEAIHDGVITTDAKGSISTLNPAAEQACGWQSIEVLGKPFEAIFRICHEYTREPLTGLVAGVLADGQSIEITAPTVLFKKDGEMIPIETSIAPIRSQNGSIGGVVMVFRDITLSREKKRRIEYLSYHDELTGLYNRRFYEQYFSQKEIKLIHPMAFVMGDVNGLKMTNDVFGHTIGDLLLKDIARTLKRTAGARHQVIRWGGDEFMIVMPGSDLKDAEVLVRQIKEQLKDICINGTIEASVSFGMALKQSRDDEPGPVLKKAEEMMYQIKLLESKSMRGTTINALLAALDEKRSETKAHTLRLSDHVMKLAERLSLNVEAKNRLILLTMLHDIGKVGIPDHILGKPGRLTEEEWQIMQTHSEIGYRIAANVPELHVVTEEILHHHEKWDGSGYPSGLSGEKIPLNSRILAIVDAYDVMTHDQVYQLARSHEDAIRELRAQSGSQFDPRLVDRFIDQVSHW